MVPPIEKDLLDTISSIATLANPILLAFIGGIGWLIQHRIETTKAKQDTQSLRINELEDKLREDRIETYNLLLEPFFYSLQQKKPPNKTQNFVIKTKTILL